MPKEHSNRIKEVRENALETRRFGDWQSCADLAREGLGLLSSSSSQSSHEWLFFKATLARCLLEIGGDDIKSNLQEAVDINQEIATHYGLDEDPETWARAQVGLGYSYFKLSEAGAREALEQSLHHHKEALHVFRKEEYPNEWATVVGGLGMVYGRRSKGGIPKNLRRAKKCYEAILDIYTEEDYPEDHADTVANIKYLEDKLAYLERELARLREDSEQT